MKPAWTIAILVWSVCVWCGADALNPIIRLESPHFTANLERQGGGTITSLVAAATNREIAGDGGFCLEGFGAGSFYWPNRRLNESLKQINPSIARYTYDCDGPNIRGLHVTRTVTLLDDKPMVVVHWRIEHKGDEDQWVTPWVEHAVAPGSQWNDDDRFDVPTLNGVVHPTREQYMAASRNWVAATDTRLRESVVGVFDANRTFAFWVDPETGRFRAVHTPVMLHPGDTWETTYCLSVLSGLAHVDFASEELAAQLDYARDQLTVLLSSNVDVNDATLKAALLPPEDDAIRLDTKRFKLGPNYLARCSYDLPGLTAGAYDVMAQLRAADVPVELGRRTHSPHGAIDTQLVIGKVRHVTLPPWTDARAPLQRGTRALERQAAVAGPVAVWFESSLDKVFEDDAPTFVGEPDPSYSLMLAQDERESWQIAIRPPSNMPLTQVQVRVNPFRHRDGFTSIPASHVRVYRVQTIPITVPSHFEGAVGDWPDALVPYSAFDAPADKTTALWFTLHAPRDAKPGQYNGTIELSIQDGPTAQVQVEATVFDFALPTRPNLKTDFVYWPDCAQRMVLDVNERDLADRYMRNALEHRVTLRGPVTLPKESADYPRSLDAWYEQVKPYLDGATTLAVPPSLGEFPEQLTQAQAFLNAKGLGGLAFAPIAHYPDPATWPRLMERIQQWHDTVPGIPVTVSTYGLSPLLAAGIGIWDVHAPILDSLNNRTVLERISEGGEVWWHVNHSPGRPYGNFFIDFAGVENRILFWQSYALGIKGMHYWGVNHYEEDTDPWNSQLDETPTNGNGCLVYPGVSGPVNSIRWEIIRDGIEDYDYLCMLRDRINALEQRGDTSALNDAQRAADLEKLIPSLIDFSRDPEVLQAKRRTIGRVLENH